MGKSQPTHKLQASVPKQVDKQSSAYFEVLKGVLVFSGEGRIHRQQHMGTGEHKRTDFGLIKQHKGSKPDGAELRASTERFGALTHQGASP